MTTPIDLTPTLTAPARATWRAIGELVRLIGNGEWVVVGGQMVAIHAARLDVTPARPTTDGDLVVDVRAHGRAAMRRVADGLMAFDDGLVCAGIGVTPLGHARFREVCRGHDRAAARRRGRRVVHRVPVGVRGGTLRCQH